MLVITPFSSECPGDLSLTEVAVVASSQASDATKPENILKTGNDGWAPMTRSGDGWKHWVEVDLRNVMR